MAPHARTRFALHGQNRQSLKRQNALHVKRGVHFCGQEGKTLEWVLSVYNDND